MRAIDLTLIALVEPEADARIVQVALENAQRMATDFNKKWYADCKRLTGLGNRLSLGASIRNRACTPRGMFSLIRGVRPIGAAMAVVAGVIFYGRQEGISIFVNLNDGLFQTIIVAGLIGAAIVAVELLVAFARFVRWLGSRIAQFTAEGSARTESKKMR